MLDKMLLEEIMKRKFIELLEQEIPKFVRRYETKKREIRESKKDKDLDFKKAVIYAATHPGLRVAAMHRLNDPNFGKKKNKSIDNKAKKDILRAFTRRDKL